MTDKNRLKILFIPAWYPAEHNLVAGVFIQEHARAVSLYNEVIVLYSEGGDKDLNKTWKIVSDKEEDGIRTIRIKHKKSPIPKTTYFIYLWSIKQAFKRLLTEGWRPDIIHAHVFSAGVPAVILGKIYKMPVVITEHWTGFPRHILGRFDILKARFAMNRAKVILPVSKDLEKAIRSYGIKNKFEIVPNVVNTEIFYPPLQKTNNKIKKMLFVGLLTPQKGIPYLFQALAKLKYKRQDFILDIIGDGLNREEYEKLSKELGLERILKFYGLKTKLEIAEFMRKCDFFVQPSLYETFGVTYIEAMACGKPIVATQLPVLQEKINKVIGILVSPKDVEALTEAINYMLDHYKDYSSEKISQYAKENFSYEAVGNQLSRIYKNIVIKN